MKKKEAKWIFKGFKNRETGEFEQQLPTVELERLVKIMAEVICGTPKVTAG